MYQAVPPYLKEASLLLYKAYIILFRLTHKNNFQVRLTPDKLQQQEKPQYCPRTTVVMISGWLGWSAGGKPRRALDPGRHHLSRVWLRSRPPAGHLPQGRCYFSLGGEKRQELMTRLAGSFYVKEWWCCVTPRHIVIVVFVYRMYCSSLSLICCTDVNSDWNIFVIYIKCNLIWVDLYFSRKCKLDTELVSRDANADKSNINFVNSEVDTQWDSMIPCWYLWRMKMLKKVEI